MMRVRKRQHSESFVNVYHLCFLVIGYTYLCTNGCKKSARRMCPICPTPESYVRLHETASCLEKMWPSGGHDVTEAFAVRVRQ